MKVLVTGSSGMIGTATLQSLVKNEYYDIHFNNRQTCDLLDTNMVLSEFKKYEPDCVIHLAGYNGNIGFNLAHPTDIYFNTGMMALNVLRASELTGVKRVITAISSCAYPDLFGDMDERNFWEGLPNSTVDCHGLSKRILDGYGMQLKKKGISYTSCIINNSFGPYDSLDINKTKVVTGMIVKFLNAVMYGKDEVVCWGSGKPKREFIYSKDVGEALVKCIPLTIDRINISSGHEITIKELAEKIKTLTGFTGEIIWDTNKPDGQNQKKLCLNLMHKNLDLKITDFDESLKETIQWVKSQLSSNI